MIAITPQMRVLVAIEPADFRWYAGTTVMRLLPSPQQYWHQ